MTGQAASRKRHDSHAAEMEIAIPRKNAFRKKKSKGGGTRRASRDAKAAKARKTSPSVGQGTYRFTRRFDRDAVDADGSWTAGLFVDRIAFRPGSALSLSGVTCSEPLTPVEVCVRKPAVLQEVRYLPDLRNSHESTATNLLDARLSHFVCATAIGRQPEERCADKMRTKATAPTPHVSRSATGCLTAHSPSPTPPRSSSGCTFSSWHRHWSNSPTR